MSCIHFASVFSALYNSKAYIPAFSHYIKAWLFGDPHITSLDGTAFTCNPIGYLLLFDSSVGARCDVKFEQTGSNNLVGSVAKGIACRDAMTGTVTFDIDDATSKVFYYPPEVRRGKYSWLGVFLLQYFLLVKI